jgi:anti-sigma factor RsiW
MRDTTQHPRGELAAYADKALEPVENTKVAGHLLDCVSCRVEVHEWQRLYHSLAHLPRPVPAAGLKDRIAFAVAREALVHRRRASTLGRRAVAALSWAYGSGLGLAAALAFGLIFVPEIRVWAASTVTWASTMGLHAGLFVIDTSSKLMTWTIDTGGALLEKAGWLETVFRALGSAAELPEVRIAAVLAVGISASIALILILGRQPRHNVHREGSHVASLIV